MNSLEQGLLLFNRAQFFEAHEAWEELWLAERGEERRFLQGLIQLAAAYHHVQRGTLRGVPRLFEAALSKLGEFPHTFMCIDRREAVAAAAEHLRRIADGDGIDTSEFPKLIQLPPLHRPDATSRTEG